MELNGAGFQQSPCCGVSTTALYCSLIYAHRIPYDSTTNSVGLESPSSIERMQNLSRSLPYNVPHARQCKSLRTKPTRSESQGGSARIGRMLRLLQLDRRKRVPKSTSGNGENGSRDWRLRIEFSAIRARSSRWIKCSLAARINLLLRLERILLNLDSSLAVLPTLRLSDLVSLSSNRCFSPRPRD